LHPCHLVNPRIRFVHVDHQSVVAAMVNGVTSQPVARQAVQRNSLEAAPETLAWTEKSLFEFFNRLFVQMKLWSLREIFITQENERRQVVPLGANQRSFLRRSDRRPVRLADSRVAVGQTDRTTKVLRFPKTCGCVSNRHKKGDERGVKQLHR